MEQVSDFVPNECGRRVDDGVDRISQLPDEILCVMLSFLRYKEAAATTVLSSRWLDLWKHIPDLKFDRISRLPNQIIAVILYFLELKEAAATSVLSSRWSDLWKHSPNLEFDIDILPRCYVNQHNDDDHLWDAHRCKFIEIVNSVIQSHKALSLKTFRLYVPGNIIAKCAVTKWLEFVFSRQVESLCLSFDEMDNLVLEELLRESRICLQPQTELIFFQSLKRLSLGFLTVSGEDINLFLRDCPLLEHLMIDCVTLTSDVEVCGEKLMLKCLEIYDCNGQKSIKVSAPNLTYMRFRDDGGKVSFESVPKLVEANFDIVRSDFASSSSCCFSQLQILNLKLNNSKMFLQLHVILANGFTQMPNLKKLNISCYQMYNHNLLPVTTALIWAYPLLEEFQLWFFGAYQEEPAYMHVMTDVWRSPHQHLKVFELLMSRRQNEGGDLVELVTYLSNNCVALHKIIIGRMGRSKSDDVANRDNLTQRLQDLWKHIPDLKLDRISLLPNQIIAVILSSLRLKEAAATCVLSSRWSDLWKHTPKLDFNRYILPRYYIDHYYDDDSLWDAHRCKFIEIVNSIIQSHKAISLKLFSLYVPGDRIPKCAVTKWLEFVFSRQVESLHLSFDLMDDLVLEELLRESRIGLQPKTELIFFESLKILSLGRLTVSGADINLFLRDCPLLEHLMIVTVNQTSDVEVCGANLMLKYLDICNCFGEKSMKIFAPNLTHMRFGDVRGGVKVLFQNVPKLFEAKFDMRRSEFTSSASCCFSQLQILKLDIRKFLQLHVILEKGFTQMPNLKKLNISCDIMYNHNLLPETTALIWAYPRLEKFKLRIWERRRKQPADMQVMTDVGRSLHQHLKVFELLMPRQNQSGDLVELVTLTYILNNCVALRKIIIGRMSSLEDVANRHRDSLTQRLQGKVPKS